MDRYYSPADRVRGDNDMSRTSSVYSSDSDIKPSPLFSDPRNATHNGSRSVSAPYTPSFMSHHATKSTERLTTPTSQPNAHRLARKPINSPALRSPPNTPVQPSDLIAPPGVLLLLIAAAVPPLTLAYLEMLLGRQTFSTIAIVASTTEETSVKQLKMDVYALIGKLGKEIAVLLFTRDNLSQSEVEKVVQDVIKNGDSVQGVLCCPESQVTDAVDDVLGISEAQLQQSWKQGTLFVHASIKATAESLISGCTPEKSTSFTRGPRGSFFLVAASLASTPTARIIESASDQLLQQIEAATKMKGLTVGRAEALLIPEPRIETLPRKEAFLTTDAFVENKHDYAFTPSESPTKLWNMWALSNDIGHAD